MTNVEPGTMLDNVNHVIQVMLLLKDTASKIQTHSYQLLMIYAQFGKIEFVLNALIELSSTLMEFADKYQLNVPLGML